MFDLDYLLLFFRGDFSRKTVRVALAADVSWVAWTVDGQMIFGLWTKNEREATDNLTKLSVTKSTLGAKLFSDLLKKSV